MYSTSVLPIPLYRSLPLLDNSAGVPDFQTVKDFIVSLGWVKGTFALFFWVTQGWIYFLYRGRLKDRQKEIDRLAQDNREYRDRFVAMLDKQFDPKQLPPPDGEWKE